ncbi:hypothetical protein BDF19DRAFT_430640 [Syncephalis fuscata]|nr:hypothetical protein BDF19DRAFT_430640 [Syncephalis fuscata]
MLLSVSCLFSILTVQSVTTTVVASPVPINSLPGKPVFIDLPGQSNHTTLEEKVVKEAKEIGNQFGISLVTGFISNGLGQALQLGKMGADVADTIASRKKKNAALAANGTAFAPASSVPVENDLFPSPNRRSSRMKNVAKVLAPSLVSGAVATAAGLGVLGVMGATVPAFTAAGVAGTVVWNRTQTAIERKFLGIGVRNDTADPRTREQRFKDTAVGLIPNIIGGAVSGLVGGAIMLKTIGTPAITDAITKKGASLLGETIGTAFAGVAQDKTVHAVRETAGHFDTRAAQLMRGGHTVIDPVTEGKTVSHEKIFSPGPSILEDVEDDISTALALGTRPGRLGFGGRGK